MQFAAPAINPRVIEVDEHAAPIQRLDQYRDRKGTGPLTAREKTLIPNEASCKPITHCQETSYGFVK